jgi:hypothetical protein
MMRWTRSLEAIKASIRAVFLRTGERPGEICGLGLRHYGGAKDKT